MHESMKPMLAADIEGDTSLLRFPLFASVKLDGIRAVTTPGRLLTRSLKPVPNSYIQETLAKLPPYIDGELIVGSPTAEDAFRVSTSGVMSRDGLPKFTFHVFDYFQDPRQPFWKRLEQLFKIVSNAKLTSFVNFVPQSVCETEADLLDYEMVALQLGYEGAMVRSTDGVYKFGRATVRDGYLTKLKRFKDAEAVVVGYEELMHNDNDKKTNALGQSERSSHKAGKRPAGTLGALRCVLPSSGLEFSVGSGYTEAVRKTLWGERGTLVGRTVKYSYFPTGSKDLPRFPVWKGFRDALDT